MAGAAYGLGVDAQGNGTTPTQIQIINRAQYVTDGLLSGGVITPSSSDMSLTVSTGAAVIGTSGIGAVIDSFDQVRLTMSPAPATGTDVYDVLVSCLNEPGARAVVRLVKNTGPGPFDKRIGRWVIPAGVTNAAAGYSENLRDNAVPVNSGQGILVDWVDKAPVWGAGAARNAIEQWKQTIYLGQDRMLDFRISQTFSARQGEGRGSFQWIVRDDVSGLITSPVLPYDEWPSGGPCIGGTYQNSFIKQLSAGWHTLTWVRQQVTGGIPMHVSGGAPAAQGSVQRPYNRVQVLDLGISY